MLSRKDLDRSGVDQANVRKLRLPRAVPEPAMPFDAEVMLDCENKALRPGEAFIIEIEGSVRFSYVVNLPDGGLKLQPAYDLAYIEVIRGSDIGKVKIVGRAFRVDWLTG
ncbi:hypothetical protein KXR63_00640 [Stutzerimonas chloritidismutans]|uniref:hypothetical protein n=1 Tax=Stutzerimonas chloritidismutans TaxID=203192 RepID=UPI003F14BAB3